MISNIYLLKNGQPTGPLSDDELRSLRAKGLITDNDLLWHDKLPDWISGSEYFGVKTVESPIQPSKLHLCANSSFVRSIPGLISCAIGALTIFAVLQIGFEVWNNSTPRFNRTSKKNERIARETSLAIQRAAASSPDYVALEYERIHRERVNDEIRQTRQDWNDYQIRHMTPQQRADEVNRQTLNRLNGR